MRLVGGERGLVVGEVHRQVPHRPELEALIRRVRRGHGDEQRLIVGELVVPRRRPLRRQPAGSQPRLGHRVDRQLQVEPLGEREERLHLRHERLARGRQPLRGQLGRSRRRRLADPVDALDAQRPRRRRPVAEHLAGEQHRRVLAEDEVVRPDIGARRAEAQFERAVGVDLDVAVVEGVQAVGDLGRGVVAVEDLERQIGGRAAPSGHDVLGVVADGRAEVERVRVVEPDLRVRRRRADEVREVLLVGPGRRDGRRMSPAR